jgi:hypothetical protein
VKAPSGTAVVVNHANLPPAGSKGYSYYYLGSTVKDADSNISQAIGALDVDVDVVPTDLSEAATKGEQVIGGNASSYLPALQTAANAAGSIGTTVSNTINQVTGGGSGEGGGGSNVTSSFGSIESLFTSESWWKGIGLVVGGAILVIIAVHNLT